MPRWPLPVLLLFSMFLLAGNGEPVRYELNNDKGLPSDEVYEVLQDSFGYLWIGCDAGLFRYDGFEYRHYTATGQNSRSISDLYLDKKDRVWCRNFTGQLFRVQDDSLLLLCNLNKGEKNLLAYAVDEQSGFYVATGSSVLSFTENGDSLGKMILSDSFARDENIIRDVTVIHDKVYCAVPQVGIFGAGTTDTSLVLVQKIGSHESRTPFISFLAANESVECLITETTESRIAEIRNDSILEICRFDHPNSAFRIHAVTFSSTHHGYWVNTNQGVFAIDLNDEKNLLKNPLFPDQKVSWTMYDREGTTWFTTLTSGIFAVPSLEVNFLSPDNSDLPEAHFTQITLDTAGNILAGSYTGRIYSMRYDESITEVLPPEDVNTFAAKDILITRYGTITARGNTVLHKTNGQKVHIPISNARDLEIAGDTLFMLLPEYLVILDLKEIAENGNSAFEIIRKVGGRSMAYNPSERILYVAFNDGIHFFHNGNMDAIGLDGNSVYANDMCYDNECIWAATVSQGLVSLKDGRPEKVYNAENILFENEMRVVHARGDCVISCSDEHLYVVDADNNAVAAYNAVSGVSPRNVNSITLRGNFVWLAEGKGIVSFPLGMKSLNEVAPHVAISNVSLDGVTLPTSDVYELPNRNYSFIVNLTSVALRSKGNYNYSYRLVEADSVWNNIPASAHSLSYSGLQPGEYTLEVVAINENGVSSVNPARIKIYVPTPLWQTWWFYLLSTIVVSCVLALLFILRIRSLRKKAEMKNKLVLSQLTALKAQMNPHFMYNALNSIQDLVLQHDVRNSSLYLSKFSQLMRAVLDGSGKEEILVEDECKMLSLYLELEKLRMGDEFSFKVNAPEKLRDARLPSMIIQPFVENALKHGLLHKKGMKQLVVDFNEDENGLNCTVTDNGIGRKRSEEINARQRPKHQSFATDAADKRVELINASGSQRCTILIIDLYDGETSVGTKVVLCFNNKS